LARSILNQQEKVVCTMMITYEKYCRISVEKAKPIVIKFGKEEEAKWSILLVPIFF